MSTYRPGFPGERHAYLQLPEGGFGRANFMGPGTALYARLDRGDPPRTDSDRAARAHDIRYALAQTPEGVAAADQRLVDVLVNIRNRGSDTWLNTKIGELPIRAKMFAERHGLLKAGTIGGYGDAPPERRAALEEFVEKETAEGYGLFLGYPPLGSAQGSSHLGGHSIAQPLQHQR